jgi:hypothetical protein
MGEIGTDENVGDREHCIYIYQLWTFYEVNLLGNGMSKLVIGHVIDLIAEGQNR